MDNLPLLGSWVVGAFCWWALVRCMRINGRPWWWRHVAGLVLMPFAIVGTAYFLFALFGAKWNSSGEPLGVTGGIFGLLVATFMFAPLVLSWKAARGKLLARPLSALTQQPVVKSEPIQTNESLHNIQTENRQSVHEAMSSTAWKKRARKARGKAELKRVPKAEPKPEPVLERTPGPVPESDPLPNITTSLPHEMGNLRFTYCDAEGKESTREITNFKLNNGRVRGFCLDSQAIRTFRLDRVVSFIEGEAALYATEARPTQRPEAPDAVRSGDPEITFSGFDAKTRSELEKTAQAHGFMVRKSVTKNLDYFVAGPRRSSSKLMEAEDKPGCSVVDKEGFLWLMATGEVKE